MPLPQQQKLARNGLLIFLGPENAFLLPDLLLVVLDMDEVTLSFVVSGQYLGLASRASFSLLLWPSGEHHVGLL